MYSDPSGNFAISLTVALVSAFVISASASAISQGMQYGWDSISIAQIALDSILAVASVAIASTGIGLLGSTLLGAAFGMGQYAASCGFHNQQITKQGLFISGMIGGIAGAISGAGARNSKLINNKLNANSIGGKGVKALTTAANKLASGQISQRGFMATFNLYGKNVFNAIHTATPGIIASNFTNNAIKIFMITGVTPFASYFGNSLFD